MIDSLSDFIACVVGIFVIIVILMVNIKDRKK